MRTLRDSQTNFLAAVLGRDPEHTAKWPLHRLTVYRNNARENFAAALESAFPLLHALMGHDEFRAMAWAFQRSCPSRSGNLFYCSAGLSGFLASHLADTVDEPLTDLTRFESLIQEVLVAADEPAHFDFETLAALPETQHASLRFRIHPATRLYSSALPLFMIWREYQQSGTLAQTSLNAAGSREDLLIRRSGDGVELHQLESAEFLFLQALLQGEPLQVAIAKAAVAESGALSPGELLARWVSAGVITGLTS
jgi:hypothetical protein